MIKRPIFLMPALALLSFSSQAGETFYVGNSLVNHYLPWVIQHLDPSRNLGYEIALINGSGLRYQWEHHDRTNNGVDAWLELPSGAYDRLVLTESVPLTSAYTWNKPALHVRRFTELALPVQPGLKVYLYGTWPHLTNTPNHPWTKPTWSEEIDGDRVLLENIATQVEAELALEQPIVIVPAGQALRLLRDAWAAGNVPELARFHDLFSDDIHLSPLGHYYIGLVFYCSLTGNDPRGLTGTIPGIWGGTYVNVPANLRTRLQDLAWQIVHMVPRSGVGLELDRDGDGVPDSSDQCQESETSQELVFNLCESGVANRELNQGCFLADPFQACAQSANSREDFLTCAEAELALLIGEGSVTAEEGSAVAICLQDWGLPNPQEDHYTLTGAGPFHFPAPGLLVNDHDPRGLTLQAMLDQPPTQGQLVIDVNGGFTYTPDPGQSGLVQFSYRCWNGEAERVAWVELQHALQTDSDGDGIADEADSCPDSAPTPTIVINGCDSGTPNLASPNGCNIADAIADCALGNPPRWAFVYCVAQLVNGKVNAGVLTRSQADAVLACAQQYDLPTAVPDTYSLPRNTTLYVPAPGLLTNDFDLEHDPMQTHLHQGPSQGTLQLARDGSFRFTPAVGQTGEVRFVYRCWDGSGYRTAPVTLQIE